MRVEVLLDVDVDVDESGRFYLPDRSYSTSELRIIAKAINRARMMLDMEQQIEGRDSIDE